MSRTTTSSRPVSASRLAGLVLGATALTPAPALAGEHRYCLAQATDAAVVYVTPPFASEEGTPALSARYGAFLERAGRPHQGAQCPVAASREEAEAFRRRAQEHQRGMGNALVPVDWRG